MTGRVRSWNSLLATEIESSQGDPVERRRFRQFLNMNELNEAQLLFLKKLWKKNRAGDESICKFMQRQGWCTRINEFALMPRIEELGFEAGELSRSRDQLTEIGAQAFRNGMQSDSLLGAIFSFFGRQDTPVTTTSS